MVKYGRARQAIGDNMIWCMHFVCWVNEVTHTPNTQKLLLFSGNNDAMNVPQYYVICTLPVLFKYI